LLYLITAISVFVLLLLVYICLRYRRKANPVASKNTHNTLLEVAWTTVPILILVAIAIPSLRYHYYIQHVVDPEMTVKVVGYQWYWHYDYPDNGGFGFDSYILKGKDLKSGDYRQLAVDNRMVVPVDTTVRVQLTGADVIHSWAVPAFGVKKDAVPGRLNETWFKATKIGTFYGQCSQLCGVGHGFMPIVVEVVSKDDFNTWTKKKQDEAGIAPAAAPAESSKPAPPAKGAAAPAKPQSNAAPAQPAKPQPAASSKPNSAAKAAKLTPSAGHRRDADEDADQVDESDKENPDSADDADKADDVFDNGKSKKKTGADDDDDDDMRDGDIREKGE